MCHLWDFYIYKRGHAGIEGAHMDGVNAYGEENLFENEVYNFFVVRFLFLSLCIFKRVYGGIQVAHMDGVNGYGEENLFENDFLQKFCGAFLFFLYFQKGVGRHSGCSHGSCSHVGGALWRPDVVLQQQHQHCVLL